MPKPDPGCDDCSKFACLLTQGDLKIPREVVEHSHIFVVLLGAVKGGLGCGEGPYKPIVYSIHTPEVSNEAEGRPFCLGYECTLASEVRGLLALLIVLVIYQLLNLLPGRRSPEDGDRMAVVNGLCFFTSSFFSPTLIGGI